MSRQQKVTFNPTIVLALGVGLLTVAIIMLITQNLGEQGVSIEAQTGFGGRIMVAFITGLTTGGLSCLAVQGGLLASSLAHQIEQDYVEQLPQRRKRLKRQQVEVKRSSTAQPTLLFLASKVVTYTLLGALLGWLGSFLALSPTTRALLMIFIGVFMLGNALRMMNVHPIFRYFSIEPPKFITRYIRRTSKGTDTVTPLFLGALTVFIPCGVTQAMMAAALATSSPLTGAAMMFAFTLGTSPVFFIVAYLTTELGARLEKLFMRFVAVVVLILGLTTLNGGLNLIGSPLSFANLTRGLTTASSAEISASVPQTDLTLMVRNDGYFPQTLKATANEEVSLSLLTNKTYSCSRDFVIPSLSFYQLLPDTGLTQVNIPAQPAGTRMFFTCSMGMYTGMIVFE